MTVFIKTIFWNKEEMRLRAAWRLAIQLVVASLLIAILTIPLGFRLDSELSREYPIVKPILTLARLGAMLASMWLAARFLDQRRFADFGLHVGPTWWVDLGFGLALGALLTTGFFLIGLALGWVTIRGTFEPGGEGIAFPAAILFALIQCICTGIYEELLSRGYQLKNLIEGFNFLNPRSAILLATLSSAAFFGLLHIGNENATAITTLSVALAGIAQSLGYLLTSELAIPIGYHVAFNFFYAHVFGGQSDAANFIAIQPSDAMPSNVLGPGAGAIGIVQAAVCALLIVGWVRLRYGIIRLHEQLTTPDLLEQI